MTLDIILKVLNAFNLDYSIMKESETISRVTIEVPNDYGDDVEQSSVYINNKTGYIIKNYEEKCRIKREIKELKDKLADLERQEEELM